MLYWYARVSERHPTLEIRVADSNADPDTTVLLAGLLRGLATTLLADIRAGVPAPRTPHELVRAAHQFAAREGIGGLAVDTLDGRSVACSRLLDALLRRATPGLYAAGDLTAVAALTRAVLGRGCGADRQRACYRKRLRRRDVVDMFTDTTELVPIRSPRPADRGRCLTAAPPGAAAPA